MGIESYKVLQLAFGETPENLGQQGAWDHLQMAERGGYLGRRCFVG